jgi:hypothetical protein
MLAISAVHRDIITTERQLRGLLQFLGSYRENSPVEMQRQRGRQIPNIISANRAIGDLFSSYWQKIQVGHRQIALPMSLTSAAG